VEGELRMRVEIWSKQRWMSCSFVVVGAGDDIVSGVMVMIVANDINVTVAKHTSAMQPTLE
jgi:hypothetical protein